MGRAIVMQEEQLKTLGKFRTTTFNTNAPQNNANVISDAFGLSQSIKGNNDVAPAPLVDMDGKTNMNIDVQNAPMVDNGVTAQIFGVTQSNDVPVLSDNQSVAQDFNIKEPTFSNDVVVNADQQNDLPYKEPSMIMNDSNNVISSLDGDDYIKDINALRDKLTSFYNDFNSQLDKLQEKVVQKSGVNLVDSAKADISNSTNLAENVSPELNVNNNYDETMVIPREVMDSAISEGFAKVA